MTIDLTKPIRVRNLRGPAVRTDALYALTVDHSTVRLDDDSSEAYRKLLEAAPDMLRFVLTMDDWLNSFDGDKDRLYMEALRHQFAVAGTLMKVGYSLGELLEIESKRTPHWVRKDFDKKDRLRAEYDQVMGLLESIADPRFETADLTYVRNVMAGAKEIIAKVEQSNS